MQAHAAPSGLKWLLLCVCGIFSSYGTVIFGPYFLHPAHWDGNIPHHEEIVVVRKDVASVGKEAETVVRSLTAYTSAASLLGQHSYLPSSTWGRCSPQMLSEKTLARLLVSQPSSLHEAEDCVTLLTPIIMDQCPKNSDLD